MTWLWFVRPTTPLLTFSGSSLDVVQYHGSSIYDYIHMTVYMHISKKRIETRKQKKSL